MFVTEMLFNPLSPGERPYFYKIITVDRKTSSNIPVERYCLGYILTDVQVSQSESRSVQRKKMKTFKIPHSFNILGIPLNTSLISSAGCADFYHVFT